MVTTAECVTPMNYSSGGWGCVKREEEARSNRQQQQEQQGGEKIKKMIGCDTAPA